MNPSDKLTFIPYHYLSDKDLEELNLLKKWIIQATSLEELRQCEQEIQWLIKKAYVRKKRGKRMR